MKRHHKKQPHYHIDLSLAILLLGTICIVAGTLGVAGARVNRPVLIAAGALMYVMALLPKLLKKALRNRKLTRADLKLIAEMDGVDFEDCCIAHFKRLGYTAEPTPTSGDYGADIVLKKNGVKTVVQCKRYKGKVGVAAVQEAVGAIAYYKADKAMVVTNSFFTPNAVELAKANKVELWDRNDLKKKFKIKEG